MILRLPGTGAGGSAEPEGSGAVEPSDASARNGGTPVDGRRYKTEQVRIFCLAGEPGMVVCTR